MAHGETYEQFTQKFKPKKTTDDCYTPPAVMEAALGWVMAHAARPFRPEDVMRPFRPGGDYEAEDYAPGRVVVDNPPFSILARIVAFYSARGVPFFLFAPSLTLFSSAVPPGAVTYLPLFVNITYENGANVNTSFVTNMLRDAQGRRPAIVVAPELTLALREADRLSRQAKADVHLPRYQYPRHLVHCGVFSLIKGMADVAIGWDEVERVRRLDAQKSTGKAVFGGGFLVSTPVAARLAEAARLERFPLSEREKRIIARLDRGEGGQREPGLWD